MKFSYRNEKNARFIAAYYSKPLNNPDWYKIEAVSDDEAEIILYDYIGWPFNSAEEFVRNLRSLTQSNIVIRINSPGGDVWDANAIHNAIKAHSSKVVTRIESLAASAASYIAVAGHEKQAYKNTMVMIHEPMTGLWGNQYELRETADILGQISSNMIDMYADNTNIGKRELKEMLKNETWMTAKEAKEKGFVDTIIEAGKPVKAQFDLSMFACVPDCLKADSTTTDTTKTTEKEIERFIRDFYDLSRSEAKAFLARGKKGVVINQHDSDPLRDAEIIAALKSNITKLNGGIYHV